MATDRYRNTTLGQLLRRSHSVQGFRLEELTESRARTLTSRFRLRDDVPARLSLRIAALELLRLEGGGYLSEDVLAVGPADLRSSSSKGPVIFRRSPSGGVSSAIVQADSGDPLIEETLERAVATVRSTSPCARRPTWPVDQALSAVIAEGHRATWGESVVTEIHPLRARRLGEPGHEPSPAALVILPLDEFRQHDETEVFFLAPEDFFRGSGSRLARLIRDGNRLAGDRDSQRVPEHLGGHKHRTNLDLGALAYLVGEFSPASFTDLGCGPGGMVFAAGHAGLRAAGIDGDPSLPDLPHLIRHDFTSSPLLTEDTDLCWCVEFLEHVEDRFVPHYLPVLERSKAVVATLAPPGQPGHHHVNCRPIPYWIEVFGRAGLRLDETRTTGIREHSTMRSNFMRDNGFVFTRGL